MKWLIFKIISFLAVFLCTQGIILPWVISNNYLPLWVDILLVTIIMVTWLAIIDYLANRLINALKKLDEPTIELDDYSE